MLAKRRLLGSTTTRSRPRPVSRTSRSTLPRRLGCNVFRADRRGPADGVNYTVLAVPEIGDDRTRVDSVETDPLVGVCLAEALRALGLYNVRAEIDSAMFAELPALTEFRLQGYPAVTRIEALLQVPHLISVEVFDSGAPVQGALISEFQHCFSPLALDYQ